MQEAMPRRRSAEERRHQILDAALALFARHGYDGTSTKSIAREAGITEGLIFHYFAGKADLLVEAAKQRGALLVAIRKMLAEADGVSAADLMPRIARGWVELVHEQGDLVVMLVAEAHAHEDVGRAFRELMDGIAAELVPFLDGRVAAGELRSGLATDVAAGTFLSTLLMFFYTRRHLGQERWAKEAERFTQELLRLWFEGSLSRGAGPA